MKVKISKCCINIICFISFSLSGQSLLPGQSDFKWGDNFVNYKQVPDSLKEEDAVILKEQLDLSDDYIKRRVSIKIQNADGIKAFQKIQLPENFDLTNFPNFSKQGHFKDRKVPPIYKYEAYYFSARIIKPNKRIINLQPEPKWIKLALGDSRSFPPGCGNCRIGT